MASDAKSRPVTQPNNTRIAHTLATNTAPSVVKLSTSIVLCLGAELMLPTLVLPNPKCLFIPECPFDVASTAGSNVTVLCSFV